MFVLSAAVSSLLFQQSMGGSRKEDVQNHRVGVFMNQEAGELLSTLMIWTLYDYVYPPDSCELASVSAEHEQQQKGGFAKNGTRGLHGPGS